MQLNGLKKKIAMATITVVVIALLGVAIGVVLSLPRSIDCNRRSYGEDRIVCVCDSSYCDTLPRPERVTWPQFLKYTTNRAGLRFSQESDTFDSFPTDPTRNEIVIDARDEYQTILGWGGAFTDAAGINVKALDADAQENWLRSYFAEDGIEYSLCRVPIGGTDFSTHGYSYNDGPEDPNLVNFALASQDFDYKIPLIKRALELTENNMKLFASAWTAPKWMKTNGEYDGIGHLKEEMYQPWANYFMKFLDSYRGQGIEFWGITTGNEPILGYLGSDINSVGWNPIQMGTWLSLNLGPTIRNSNYSSIKIIALDDQRFNLPWYPYWMISNVPQSQNFFDGFGLHWYGDRITPPETLDAAHGFFPDRFMLLTEACNGFLPTDVKVLLGSWERGERYASNIIENVRHWSGGWIDWNMSLDPQGGPTYISNFVDSPIIVNATAGEFYKQPMFYALGHFSKFVPRDSIRIGSTSFDEEIRTVAFKRPDGGRVLVILNMPVMLQLIMQGKLDGKRGPGRRRISWLKNLRQWTGMTSLDLFRAAGNKIKWAIMIANVH